uniref:TLE family member 3, transcriptional corepressor n=1 Tax=Neogobius melanostomus TaxID=47308 RepID=A0A8C6UUG8_9GOBI
SNLHYLYYEMSYGLNIEMHKQTEIAKRLNAILAQIMPFLSQEHQQQVAQAVERAKQVTMTELNAIIGVRGLPNLPLTVLQLPPHPSGLQPPGLPPVTGAGSGLLALGALGSQAHLPDGSKGPEEQTLFIFLNCAPAPHALSVYFVF